MDSRSVLVEHGAVSGAGEGRQRRFYPVEEKRRMVEQTLEVGASVARVAQENGVNANLLFLWRRQHREGRLTGARATPVRLLPVTVTADQPGCSRSEATEVSAPSIHVELPKGRIWIEGQVDAVALRMVLEFLSR
jgi:transposase